VYEPTHIKPTTKPSGVDTPERAGAASSAAPRVPAFDPAFLRGSRFGRNENPYASDARGADGGSVNPGVPGASSAPDDYWPCACHRTYRGKRQIKLHSRAVARCRSCGVTRAQSDAA
jgi:hypothetical protein